MDAPPMLSAGEQITIATPDSTFTFIIDKPFAPFTKAVVLLARCPELGPDPAIVKIFDPRFLNDRLTTTRRTPPRPWSLDLERAAAALPPDAFDERKLWGPLPDEPESSDGEDDSGGEDDNDEGDEGDADADHNEQEGNDSHTGEDVSDGSDSVRDDPPPMTAEAQALERFVMWEEHFRRLSAMCFESERNAYAHLRELQGTAIPQLYLVGTWLPPDERAIQLPALVMEYIPDAVTLGDVPGDVLDPEMCATLIRTIETFRVMAYIMAISTTTTSSSHPRSGRGAQSSLTSAARPPGRSSPPRSHGISICHSTTTGYGFALLWVAGRVLISRLMSGHHLWKGPGPYHLWEPDQAPPASAVVEVA